MTWENLSFGSEQPDALPMSAHLIMLALDVVLYFALALYLDNVVPGGCSVGAGGDVLWLIRFKHFYFHLIHVLFFIL